MRGKNGGKQKTNMAILIKPIPPTLSPVIKRKYLNRKPPQIFHFPKRRITYCSILTISQKIKII
jgi:hypothetical protein